MKYKISDSKNDCIVYEGLELHRIIALKTFGIVKSGDKGGYIENMDNLSQEGDSWVFNNAKVYDGAKVYDDAKVSGNAEVYGAAKVFDDAHVGGDANVYKSSVYGSAHVYGYARVKDGAKVYGAARVSGNAEVYDKAKVYDTAEVFGSAKVFRSAEVFDDARVCALAQVSDSSKVFGNARVFDSSKVFNACVRDASVFGKADIFNVEVSSDADYIVFKNWWSSGRYFTWTRRNNRYIVGCFYGTGEELIKKAYSDSKESGDNYKAIVDYVNNVVLNKK